MSIGTANLLRQAEDDYQGPSEVTSRKPDCLRKILYVLNDGNSQGLKDCAECNGSQTACTNGRYASVRHASPKVLNGLLRLRNRIEELSEIALTCGDVEPEVDVYACMDIAEDYDPLRHPVNQSLVDTVIMHADDLAGDITAQEAINAGADARRVIDKSRRSWLPPKGMVVVADPRNVPGSINSENYRF